MSGSWVVKNLKRGNERECDSRSEAEERKSDIVSLGASPDDIEIIPPTEDVEPEVVDHTEDTAADGGSETVVSPAGHPIEADVNEGGPTQEDLEEDPDIITGVEDLEDGGYDLPEKPDVDKNPIEWMPSHFIDEIQGVPTVNRMGYCILCEQYGVSVKAEPVTLPSETDFEYAEFRAVATTEDGQEYTGFGSAHVERQDGDDPHLLAELAETRSLKRAAAWATGIGMTAAVEMGGSE